MSIKKIPEIQKQLTRSVIDFQNIKNVENDEDKILNAIEQIDGKKVKSTFDFGDGQSSKRFFDIISKTEIWDINLQKYFIEMDEKN